MSDYVSGLKNVLESENKELREQNAKLQAMIEAYKLQVAELIEGHVNASEEHHNLCEKIRKLQAMIRDMLTCNFTQDKCSECYGKAHLLVSEESPTC